MKILPMPTPGREAKSLKYGTPTFLPSWKASTQTNKQKMKFLRKKVPRKLTSPSRSAQAMPITGHRGFPSKTVLL